MYSVLLFSENRAIKVSDSFQFASVLKAVRFNRHFRIGNFQIKAILAQFSYLNHSNAVVYVGPSYVLLIFDILTKIFYF